jgi:hypothetical protein
VHAILSLRRGLAICHFLPTACAVGCILAPLCGLAAGGSQIGARRNSSAAKARGFSRTCGMAEAMPSHGLSDALRRFETASQIVKDPHYPMDNVSIRMLSAKSTGVNDKVAPSRELALVATEELSGGRERAKCRSRR